MSLTGLFCNIVHTIMFMYACMCALYLLQEFVPQHFVTIEALKYKLWDSTLKPVCMAAIQLITDLFQDHYKDFLWVVEAFDIKHFVPLSVSTIISPVFTLAWKIYDILGRLASQFYRWITLEKFVYIYPVAFWVVSFVYALFSRRWQALDNNEEDEDVDEEEDDKSGDEGDDEDSDDDDEEGGEDDDGLSDRQEEEEFIRDQQRMHRMRRHWIRQVDRLRRRRRGGSVDQQNMPRINNVGPMYNSLRLDDRLCSICCENERNAVLLPCGHTNLCLLCAYNYNDINKSCPFCQMTVETIHRIFL